MSTEPLSNLIDNINVWKRGEERAPHKPLLLLLALGELSRGRSELPFVDCEKKLRDLLREFGPSPHQRQSYHPEYPFWRLQNDGLWVVRVDRPVNQRKSNTDIPVTELRDANAIGSFPDDIRRRLSNDSSLLQDTARRLLSANFPESLHQDILDMVGLSLETSTISVRSRDPSFRPAVLAAYSRRCAVCGLDLRIDDITIGLEAAHIKWYVAGGPNEISNGLALCTLHHKLFDLGAYTLDRELRILVSERVNGTAQFEEVLLRYHGATIARLSRPEYQPQHCHLSWHREQVFKERARYFAVDDD
jgi:putative restriction endonuclease